MKLKLVGDGSDSGTIVVDEATGSELEMLHGFAWKKPNGNSGNLTLKVSNIALEIDPSKPFNRNATPKSLLRAASFRLKIVGDGTTSGTAVVDADTEEEIDVDGMQWNWDDDVGDMILTIELSSAIVSIDPTNSMPSGTYPFNPQNIGTQQSSVSGQTSPPSTSASYTFGAVGYGSAGTPGASGGGPCGTGGSYNPYHNPNTQPPPPSTGPSDPLLPPDMPLDFSVSASTKCPLCGHSAYIGFNSIECKNFLCKYFKK